MILKKQMNVFKQALIEIVLKWDKNQPQPEDEIFICKSSCGIHEIFVLES